MCEYVTLCHFVYVFISLFMCLDLIWLTLQLFDHMVVALTLPLLAEVLWLLLGVSICAVFPAYFSYPFCFFIYSDLRYG